MKTLTITLTVENHDDVTVFESRILKTISDTEFFLGIDIEDTLKVEITDSE